MRDHLINLGGVSSFSALLYALAQFSVQNVDIMMAALGPFAFRVAPHVPYISARMVQRIYIALAIVAAVVAAVKLIQRARKRFFE